MAYELYQTLDIPTQSSTEEIRRSYYRLVRKHSPEKDPEKFKVIREAYETLSDPKAKQNYDSLQQHGGEIIVLLSQAEDRIGEENICIIHLRNNQVEQVTSTAEQIISCLPADEDVRNYVAAKFAVIGSELVQAGAKYINPHILKAALTFMEAAKRFSPGNTEIAKIHKDISEVVSAFNQYDVLKDDYQIIHGFKRLAAFSIINALGAQHSDYERDTNFKSIIEEISNSIDSEVLVSAQRIKSKYPTIYLLNSGFFGQLEKAAMEIASKQQYQPQYQATNNSSDSCFVVTATYGTPYAPEVMKYRYFRDEYLTKNILGRKFISHYYRFGPIAASYIKKHPNVKKVMAFILGNLANYLPNEK
ncbi:J domain-containing protein [uncultured Nostoc sp.]|uniref:J domain-containing protein n=1 Tax=uncultured Nostoc sp. TaxID=340711 RepID=UPI002635912F|nr:J domain-containing protein [uncultured Nostoc sp.]